jgi:hypothetical protein
MWSVFIFEVNTLFVVLLVGINSLNDYEIIIVSLLIFIVSLCLYSLLILWILSALASLSSSH